MSNVLPLSTEPTLLLFLITQNLLDKNLKFYIQQCWFFILLYSFLPVKAFHIFLEKIFIETPLDLVHSHLDHYNKTNAVSKVYPQLRKFRLNWKNLVFYIIQIKPLTTKLSFPNKTLCIISRIVLKSLFQTGFLICLSYNRNNKIAFKIIQTKEVPQIGSNLTGSLNNFIKFRTSNQ